MVKFLKVREKITSLFNFQKNKQEVSSTLKAEKAMFMPIENESRLNPPFCVQIIEKQKDQYTIPPGTDFGPGDHFLPSDDSLNLLNAYLLSHKNVEEDIFRLKKILDMPNILFEIGCGSGEASYEIALKNPDWGVIATDKYDWAVPAKAGSHYQKVALAWKDKQLKIQQYLPDNMVVLRAEIDILRFFPDYRLDSVLMLNPEPKVCEAFLRFISETSWYNKIKPGADQILVIPFSREIGVTACGGFECAYTEERPGELMFLKVGNFHFRQGEKIHWGIDMTRASAYSRNSTQNDVYIYGNQFQEKPLSAWNKMIKKIF
jgi:hypothetical protein